VDSQIMDFLSYAQALLHLFVLFDTAIRPARAFPAADKQTKNLWLTLFGLAVATDIFFVSSPLGLFMLAGTVAALVYMVDVRPAVKAIGRGGGGGGWKRRPSGGGGW
jgi:hypothetical protein